jgi:hypothetical protein
METQQLSVLDLPPQNVLGILPRFKIAVSGKDAEAIAQFTEAIGEIRLDQLPDELAGNGKSDRHTQAVIPIEIKVGDHPKSPAIDGNVSGIFPISGNIPETTLKPRRHGTIEDYLAKGRNGKFYKYQRYVYLDADKIYRHHHIPQKQTEAITTLWAGGATAKEICVALGKKCKSK